MGCRHENDPPGIIILTDCQPEAIIEESIHAGMTVILRRASVELNKQNHRKKFSRQDIVDMMCRAAEGPRQQQKDVEI